MCVCAWDKEKFFSLMESEQIPSNEPWPSPVFQKKSESRLGLGGCRNHEACHPSSQSPTSQRENYEFVVVRAGKEEASGSPLNMFKRELISFAARIYQATLSIRTMCGAYLRFHFVC